MHLFPRLRARARLPSRSHKEYSNIRHLATTHKTRIGGPGVLFVTWKTVWLHRGDPAHARCTWKPMTKAGGLPPARRFGNGKTPGPDVKSAQQNVV